MSTDGKEKNGDIEGENSPVEHSTPAVRKESLFDETNSAEEVDFPKDLPGSQSITQTANSYRETDSDSYSDTSDNDDLEEEDSEVEDENDNDNAYRDVKTNSSKTEHPFRDTAEATEKNHCPTDEDIPGYKQIVSLFRKKQLNGMSKILKSIDQQLPRDFREYKHAVAAREKRAERLISRLIKENVELKRKIGTYKKGGRKIINDSIPDNSYPVQHTRLSNPNIFSTIISSTTEADYERCSTIISMLELLTGVRCLVLKETANDIQFTLEQRGESKFHYYQLLIEKPGNSDITYIPIWSKPDHFSGDWDENVNAVKKSLRSYLQSEFKFPPNAILKFQNELSVSLN